MLRGMAVAPVVGAYAAEQAVSGSSYPLPLSGGAETARLSAGSASTFRTFAKWWTDIGKNLIKEQAKNIQGFDADILTLHCPLATKVRYQRARNFERLLKEREGWFDATMKHSGKVTWWV